MLNLRTTEVREAIDLKYRLRKALPGFFIILLVMPQFTLRMRAFFMQMNSKQQFSIATVKKHVPLIRFRAQLKRTSEKKPVLKEDVFKELTFHPNFYRKPISEEEIANFQV
ncbi:expressed conserved protein [Echinococcus multilocularis]|uniref:Expressed conserved protein n=1 Tax=Echinococcus multilocularis TaxID=6211 RepID=A0A068YFS5_ECHMU|nr:expressed conserved protein [Echinococcus multilocularis]